MKPQTGAGYKTPKRKNLKTLKERVRQHVTDKNDVITEDDLKNIPIGEDAFKAAQDLSADLENADDLADTITERKATSPWTILSEEDK